MLGRLRGYIPKVYVLQDQDQEILAGETSGKISEKYVLRLKDQ